MNFEPGDHASSVAISVWLNLSRPIFPEAEQKIKETKRTTVIPER